MKIAKHPFPHLLLATIITTLSLTACPIIGDGTPPIISSSLPTAFETGVSITTLISTTFSEDMDIATMVAANMTLANGDSLVPGAVSYDQATKTMTLAPSELLAPLTVYTVTITTGVKDLTGVAMVNPASWTFTTAAAGLGPAPVILKSAANYVILAKTGISTVPASVITGNIGLSPAAESFMTGFSQTKHTGYSTSPQVTGSMFAADSTAPTPTNLIIAVLDMEAAFTDAAGRPTPDHLNLGSGSIGGLSLGAGLYKWTSSVNILSDLTINGGPNDIWIFQISGNLSMAAAKNVILTGGAQAQNLFWQVSGTVATGTSAQFSGIILSQTSITLGNKSSLIGRALAQSAVSSDQASITKP